MHHILIVDDDPHIGRLLEAALVRHDCQVTVLQQPTEALSRIQQMPPDLLILDVLMPELTGFELLAQLRQETALKDVPVLFTTASHDLKRLEQIFELGCDYLSKPIRINELVARVRFQLQLRQRTLTMQRQQAELDSLKAHLSTQVPRRPGAFAAVITNSAKMLSLFPYCEAVSQSPRPILITGETGTGKELVARAIHQASGRSGKLVVVNISGVEESLLASTLFGHRRGAFSGAEQDRAGLIEQAAGGTLVLDEIGELSPVAQVKLLRLLESGEYYPVGSDLPRQCQAALIAITSRDLEAAVAAGDFRHDLYYRLLSHLIHLPPLRERLEDLALLVPYFAQQARERLGVAEQELDPALVPALRGYGFPGNVRELQALIFDLVSRQASAGKRLLSVAGLPERLLRELATRPPADPPAAPGEAEVSARERRETPFPSLRAATERHIREAMLQAEGNIAEASRLLGLTPQALYKRLQRHPDLASESGKLGADGAKLPAIEDEDE